MPKYFNDKIQGGTNSATPTTNKNVKYFSDKIADASANENTNSSANYNTARTGNRSFTTKSGTTVSESQINEWLDPNYEWKDGERKTARELSKNIANNISNIPDNQKASYYDMFSELDDRSKYGQGLMAFAKGILESTPFYKAAENKVVSGMEERAKDDAYVQQKLDTYNRDNEFDANHKFAEGAGNFVGKMSQYSALKNVPIVDKIATGIGTKLGGGALAKGIGNVTADTLTDLALDTIPELATNISLGKSGKEIAKDTAKNIGTNIAFNVGGEALSQGLDAIKSTKDMINTLADAKGSYDIPKLDTVIDATKNIDNVVDAVKNADEVVDATKSADGIADSVKTAENVVEEPKLQSFEELISEGAKTEPTQQIPTLDLDYETKHLQSQKQVWESLRSQLGDELGDENFKMLMGDDALNPEEYFKSAEEYLDSVRKGTDIDVPDITKEVTNTVEESVPEVAKQTEIPKIEEPVPELPKLEEPKIEEPTEFNAPDKYAQIEKADDVVETAKELPDIPSNEVGNTIELEPVYKNSKMVTNGTLNRNAITSMETETGRQIAKYKEIKESTSMADATKRLSTEEGYKYWNDSIIKGDATIESPADVDTTMSLLLDKKNKIAAIDEYIKNGGVDAEEAMKTASKLQAETDILSMRLRQISTKNAQALQSLAKWNRNFDGAITNSERLLDMRGQKWAKSNGKKAKAIKNVSTEIVEKGKEAKVKTPLNSKLKKALDGLVDKSVFKNADGVEKTHADYLAEVKGTFSKEMSSMDANFTDADYEVLATFLENNIDPEIISDELAYKLKNGTWYTLDESIEEVAKGNGVVNSALKKMLGDDVVENIKKVTEEDIRESIKASFDGELAGTFTDITDADIDYVKNLVENGIKDNELAEMLQTRAATGKWNIDNEVVEEVNNIFKEAEYYGIDSKERVELENKAFSLLADNIYGRGGTGWEKFDQWRYLAMLGNTKTHIRNVVSNAIFGAVHDVSNTLAATMEEAIDRTSKLMGGEGIERTKSILNPTKDGNLIKKSLEDASESSYRQLSGSKYSTDLKREIQKQRKVFKSNVMNNVSDFNTNALELEDIAFNKKKYSTSLAGYLKANGLGEEVFEAERRLKNLEGMDNLNPLLRQEMDELKQQVDVLDKGREYAVKQAQYSTFHEDNIVAEAISSVERKARNSDNALARVGGKMLEGVVPFAKTPANILRSGLEYSPLGLIRDAVDVKDLAKGNINAAQFVENLSKTVTGTSLMLLGMWMYDNDMLSASANEDTKYFDENKGEQTYAVKIGDKTFTIDFAVPSAMPLLVGAEIGKVFQDDNFDLSDVNSLVNALSSIAEPINDTSMLSGINNTIDAIKNSDDIFGTLAFNSLTGYLTQSVPTMLGQVARTIDNTRRSTYAENTGAVGSVEKQLNKVENKIPFLSKNNEAYVDLWGREQNNGPDNALGNLAYQMLSPTYYSNVNATPVDTELQSLYDTTKNKSVLPSSHAYKIGDERMSQSDKYTYAKTNGETRYNLLDNLIQTDLYKNSSNEEKADLISSVYTLSAKVAKYEVTGDDSDDNTKLYSAYKSGGIPSVIDYYTTKDALENAGFSISNDKAISVYDKYGERGLSIMKSIKSLGSTKKETLTGYLDKLNMTNEEKAYWFDLFNTGSNPYTN